MIEVYPHNMMSYVVWQTLDHKTPGMRHLIAAMPGGLVCMLPLHENTSELHLRIAIDRAENFFWMMVRSGIFIESES